MDNKTGFQVINNSNSDLIAVYYNDKGYRAFNIIELRDGYASTCCIKGIDTMFLSYSDAHNLCTNDEKELSTEEWRKCVLQHVFETFEENYNYQVSNLIASL